MQIRDRTTSLINPSRSSLLWDQIGFSVDKKVILSECSGIAYSGQVIGIFGASGCGKSTFLNTISGRLGRGKMEGKVLFNGRQRVKKTWKSACAFVEQDEVMYRHLTVRETLMYAAELKLPSSMPQAEKKNRVDSLIQQLGLSRCQNTKIGDPDNKGISGGERKRVAIGIEMVSDPSVFLLDEPTSGLDAYTAINLVRTLRDIGLESRRITLMTVHQPRNELLDLFDSVIILARGKIVFSGTVPAALDHFKRLGFTLPPLTNPADFFLDITSIDHHSPEAEVESINRIESFQKAWMIVQKPLPKPQVVIETTWQNARRPWSTAFSILFHRNVKDMLRNRTVMYATVVQTVIVMLIIGLVYKDVPSEVIQGVQNRLGSFVFMGLYNSFMNVIPTVLIFPQHRQVIRRERAAGSYSASAAYMAKFVSLIPLCWITSVILSIPMPFFLGLQAKSDAKSYAIFIFSFLIQSQAACAFGLMVGAGVVNGTTGLLIAFPILIVMLLFGGLLINLSTLHPAVYWLQFLSIIANCTKSVTLIELPGLTYSFSLGGVDLQPNEKLLDLVGRFGLGSVPVYGLMLLNASLAIVFTVIGYILFRYTAAPSFNLGCTSSEENHHDKFVPGIRHLSDPNSVEIPLNDISCDTEDRPSSFLPFSPSSNISELSPVYKSDQDSNYGNDTLFGEGQSSGKQNSIYGLYEEGKSRTSTTSSIRMPRLQSKMANIEDPKSPTKIYMQSISNNMRGVNANQRRSHHNSITFSDLDYYMDGVNDRE